MAEIDIEALRREAKGDGRECVPVTRRFLKAVLERIEAPAVLDARAVDCSTYDRADPA